jgi:molecular chaperone Hsp33
MDYTIRAISQDGYIRGFVALTTDLVQELQHRHHTFPVASAALGRTATMGALLSLTIKEKTDRITIQVEGNGPLGRILVDTDGQGTVRGYVNNPDVLIPLNDKGKLDVAKAVGQGSIYLTHDIGLKKPYQSTSPIISGELAEDFTYYFTASEQTPSSIGLGVLVNRDKILVAGGYMLQLMPGATEETIARLEKQVSQLTSVSDLLSSGITPEKLLTRLMGEDARFLEKKEVRFGCTCSNDKIQKMLMGLGKEELTSIIEEIGQAEVICHFCNEKYLFNKEDLIKIIQEFH